MRHPFHYRMIRIDIQAAQGGQEPDRQNRKESKEDGARPEHAEHDNLKGTKEGMDVEDGNEFGPNERGGAGEPFCGCAR